MFYFLLAILCWYASVYENSSDRFKELRGVGLEVIHVSAQAPWLRAGSAKAGSRHMAWLARSSS